MVAGRFQHHLRRRLSPTGAGVWFVGTEISSTKKPVAKLTAELGFDGVVLGLSEISAANSTLIGDHQKFVTRAFQSPQGFGNTLQNFNRLRVATVIDFPDDGPIAIKKDCGSESVSWRARHCENWPAIHPPLPSLCRACRQ